MANVINSLGSAIYTKLANQPSLITALGGTYIFDQIAWQPAPDRFCVYQQQGGGDANESPTRMRELLYTVRGVAKTKPVAGSIDAAIDDALHNKTLTVTGWSNILCMRETDINFVEQDAGGVNRFHAGAIYRIIIDS